MSLNLLATMAPLSLAQRHVLSHLSKNVAPCLDPGLGNVNIFFDAKLRRFVGMERKNGLKPQTPDFHLSSVGNKTKTGP